MYVYIINSVFGYWGGIGKGMCSHLLGTIISAYINIITLIRDYRGAYQRGTAVE